MVLNKYFYEYANIVKNFIIDYIIVPTDKSKTIIYLIFFLVYFFLYYSISIPQNSKDSNNNPMFKIGNDIHDIKWLIPTIDGVVLAGIIVGMVFYFIKFEYITPKLQVAIILPGILILNVLSFLNVLTYSKELVVVSDSPVTKYIFVIFSSIFYVIFFILFLYNINNALNIEFFITILLLVLFTVEYILITLGNINQTYSQLRYNNYPTLSINCLPSNKYDNFSNSTSNNNTQILDISKKYGDNYLKTNGSIPISFFNKEINNYQDLVLADFYYPGSYYSYIADSPLTGGTPSLDALSIVLSKFKVRVIHLDIYSDRSNEYDPLCLPVVRCKNMSEGASPLNFMEVLGLINKWAWATDNNNLPYPFFLYLNLNFSDNEAMYTRIYENLVKMFSKYFIDKKYSFSGRNGIFPVSLAKMKECLGKIIIVTNKFPTKSLLDELINASTNDLNVNFNLKEYKDTYITFNEIGVSQDNDKNDLVNSSKTNINFYYSEPNAKYKNINQIKSGLFNPSFQDCAQYGIQSTLMYIFLPDDNLNKWNMFFKNKNNLDPVLKDELLRTVNGRKQEIVKQNPVIGLQKPQKYCIIPGMLSTDKSNISGDPTNNTC